jgi:hypothetical protein
VLDIFFREYDGAILSKEKQRLLRQHASILSRHAGALVSPCRHLKPHLRRLPGVWEPKLEQDRHSVADRRTKEPHCLIIVGDRCTALHADISCFAQRKGQWLGAFDHELDWLC